MIHDIERAWERFAQCQQSADHFRIGGYWARLSLTRSEKEFRKLCKQIPSGLGNPAELKYMGEGVYWLQIMQRYADRVVPSSRPGLSVAEQKAKSAAEHAIACFAFAIEQRGYRMEDD